MDYTTKLNSSRKLITKGCCFLCLKTTKIHQAKNPHEGNEVHQDFFGELKFISIRQLLHHLQIPTAESLNGGSSFLQDFKKEDVQVELCKTCGQTISRFSVLFKKLENIRLEMDYFLEGIHKCIVQSAMDSNLVQIYSKKMTSDLEALSQLAFVDNLRKQVSKKCLKELNFPRIQVILNRGNCKLFKMENNMEACESNDWEFPGSGSGNTDETYFPAFATSPPPSPNTTEVSVEESLFTFSTSSASISIKRENPSTSVNPPFKGKTKRSKLSKYYTRHPSTGMYECNKCDKKSTSPQPIIKHYKSVHLKLRHKCNICNVSVFRHPSHLSFHKKTCRKNLEKNLAKETDPRFKFICKICGKRFEANSKLVDHTRWVHKNANRFQCDLCDKKYASKAMLNDHHATIHLSRKFYCKGCNKVYTYMQKLKKHEKKCVAVVKVKQEETL